MAAASVIVLLSLFIMPVVSTGNAEQPLTLVVNALSKLVRYYTNNYREINLDGLFGLRAVEGQLDLLLAEHGQGLHQHLPASLLSTLQRLRAEAANTSREAIQFVQQDDEAYYQSMKYIIDGPWRYFKKHRKLNRVHIWSSNVYSARGAVELDEEKSDSCMKELIGSVQDNKQPCQVSSKCLTIMTQRGLSGYGITHQILWTMLAERTGCAEVVNFLLKNIGVGNIDNLQETLCTNNYIEMETSVHTVMKNTVEPGYQDLFLEQQFICPSAGYFEFLSSDYLRQILSWQTSNGCYGRDPSKDGDQETNRPQRKKKFRDLPSIADSVLLKQAEMLGKLAKQGDAQVESLSQTVPAGPAIQNPAPPGRVPGQSDLQAAGENQVGGARHQGAPVSSNRNGHAIEKSTTQGLRKAGENPPSGPAALQWKPKDRMAPRLEKGPEIPAVPAPSRAAIPAWRQAVLKPRDAPNPADPQLLQPARGWPNDKPPSLRTVPPHGRPGQDAGSPLPARQVPFVREEAVPGGRARLQSDLQPPFQHRAFRRLSLRRGRKLLVEKDLADGCLSHKTAVAGGALVIYLRYLIDPGPMALNQTGHILQETSRNLLEQGAGVADSQKVKKEGLIPVKQNMIQNEDDFKEEEEEEEDVDENPIDNTLDGDEDEDNMDFNEDEDDDEEDLDEDNADEDGTYKDDGDADTDYNDTNDNNDEMYPENNNIDPNNRDQKIVHFGGDHQQARGGAGKRAGFPGYYKGEDEDGETMGGKKKETQEQQAQDDMEYTYYDEPDEESEKKNMDSPKKEMPVNAKLEVPNKAQPPGYPSEANHTDLNSSQLSPKVMVFIFSASFLLLFFLAYKFIRRRRLHIRYRLKGLFRL